MADATSAGLPMATLACGHVNKKFGSRAAPHYSDRHTVDNMMHYSPANGLTE